MANLISLFPKYYYHEEDGIFDMSNFYSFRYSSQEKDYALKAIDEDRGGYVLKDEADDFWNPELNNLKVSRQIRVRHARRLYGSGTTPVACHDAKIGLAVAWYSPSSGRRNILGRREIQNSDEEQVIQISGEFPRASLRGRIDFSVLLYLAKSGHPYQDKSYLANESGTILGEMEKITIYIDGDAAMFPITFSSLGKDQPLWSLETNFDNPETEEFSSSVLLVVNSDNPEAEFLDKRKKDVYNSFLMKEIVASAMVLLVETIREYDDQFSFLDDVEPGGSTVANVIYYFKNTLGWDLETPQSVSVSARNFLEKNIKKL